MSDALPARRAEQITATVLFADVTGFSQLSAKAGTERAYLAVTQLLRLLDGVVRKHGGSVDKYLGDKLMAVFGYPVPVERPASAATTAALEMRQTVVDYLREADLASPLGIQIGINTGELVGGDIRGPVVREFHVLGDAVNVAARINAKTPEGGIWVGPRTYEEAREDFGWDALEPLLFKGKSQPVAVFSLQGSRREAPRDRLVSAQRAFVDLVGRESELSRLRASAAALVGGTGGAVLVLGEEGSGKSRLLGALGEAPEAASLAVRQQRASPMDRDREGASLAPLVREPVPTPHSPGGFAAALRRELESAAKEGPLLVALEDIQWMDASSTEALAELLLLAAEEPILFLMTARPGPEAARLAEIAGARLGDRCQLIELGGLGADEARSLARTALGDAADEQTLDLVVERGGDLPGPLLQAAFLAPSLRSEREQEGDRAERSTEAERRRAAVVFADLSGFTAMTERVGAAEAYPVVAACLEILDEAARTHGGTVDHYLGDCVMALFGVPHAIEDAPRAALNAAIDMRRRIQEFNRSHDLSVPVDVHTGVATGLGIAGDISGPMIREFAVMGDHVDRADELTHAAEPGEIRVDDPTRHATRELFEFSEAEQRGSEPTWNLLSTTPRLHRVRVGAGRQVFSELVGRDEQLGTLLDGLGALRRGEGGVISITAEAGIGKSRLLAELRGSDEAKDLTWLEGRALSNGRNLRYHPIADLVRSWATIADEDDETSARHKLDAAVAALLPEGVDETAPLLANLMGAQLRPDEQDRLAAMQGDAGEKLVRGAVVQLLRAAGARRPLVVVMEDLHWADLSSVELVESLLRLAEDEPILFVNAFRPDFEETSGRVAAFARDHLADHHVELALEPLDASAARTLVKNLFRGGDVPQTTRAAIEERARGNPFYIEEVVRTLVDVGAVEIRDGRFHATASLGSVAIPDTVQEAVMARVDRLDLVRKSVLQAAAVIGGSFHVEVLEEVAEGGGLAERLAELEEGEFIVPSDRSAGREYAFKHPLIQEVTYDALLETRRRELHLAVAHASEQRLSDGLPGYCAMLAYHFSMGRHAERAEDYLFRAGDEAARAAASNEALHFFREASALYEELHPDGGDLAKRARLEKSLAIALMNRGRLIESVDHFDETTRLLGRSSPRGAVTMGASFAANLLLLLARLYLGRPYGRRPATDRTRELIDVMFRRAMAQSTTNPTRFFVDATALVRTLSGYDPHTVPESAAIFSGVIAIFSFGGISFDVGRRFLDVAQRLADEGAVDERVLYYRTLRFLHHLLAGDWSEDHTIDPELVDEGIREGRFWEVSTYLDLDCHRRIYQGKFDRAREQIAKLAEIADLYEHDLASSGEHAHTAFLHVERREFDAALRALETYYDEHPEALFNVLALGMRARVYALQGEVEQAAAEVARAESVMAQAGRVAPFHASAVHSARYLIDVLALERAVAGGHDWASAARRARASRKAALGTSAKVAWRRTEALRLAGREAWLCGRHAEGIAWWGRALDCGRELGAQPEIGRTLADAGRALSDQDGDLALQGRDARACLEQARELFEELQIPDDRALISDSA